VQFFLATAVAKRNRAETENRALKAEVDALRLQLRAQQKPGSKPR